MTEFLRGQALKEYINNPGLAQQAIVEGLIFKDTINILYSEPGKGKSVIAVNMLASMSGGWPVFGLLPMKRFVKCSYMMLEGSMDEQLSRFKEMTEDIAVDYENIAWHTAPFLVEDKDSQAEVFKQLAEHEPEVIFIDSLYCMTSKGLSKEENFLPVRDLLKKLKYVTGAAIIALHHSSKPQYEKGRKVRKDDPFLGSQYLKACADYMGNCQSMSKKKTVITTTKLHRNNEGVEEISLEFNPHNWTVNALKDGTTLPATIKIKNAFAKLSLESKEITTKDIIKESGLSRRHIDRLRTDGHFISFCNFSDDDGLNKKWIKK